MDSIFIVLFLIIFPFGQIIRLSFNFAGLAIPLQPIDVIVGAAAVYVFLRKLKRPAIFKHFLNFLAVAVFSFIVSVFVFKSTALVYGLFYLIRLCAYCYFLVYVWNFVRDNLTGKRLLLDSLLAVSVFSAIFGWIQFFVYPSIKPFFVWGWDEHLYRLVGTFLDPTFLGLIIVFGLILAISRLYDSKRKKYLFLTLFLLVSLAFTYSRASYLAFFAGIFTFAFLLKKLKEVLILILGFILLILVLPTAANHVLSFTRSFSALARIENYVQTFNLFKHSPVIGVGYDNLCMAYQKYIGPQDFSSHSCSGSDSSLLFVLATTGLVGFMIFTNLVVNVVKALGKSLEAKVFSASAAALLVHSLFSNSMFYPWIMGYLIILFSVSLRE